MFNKRRHAVLHVEQLEDRVTPSAASSVPVQFGTLVNADPASLGANLAAIRAVTLQIDPTLAQVHDSLTLAIDLRDFIYQRFTVGSNDPSWVSESPYARYVQAIVLQEEPLLCQGAQIVYADLALSFGIDARYVSMFAVGTPDNHATDEVLIAGQWIAMDPTFNVAYVAPTTGQYLSYAQLQAGVPYEVTHNGMPERSQLNYEAAFSSVPLEAYLQDVTYPPLLDPAGYIGAHPSVAHTHRSTAHTAATRPITSSVVAYVTTGSADAPTTTAPPNPGLDVDPHAATVSDAAVLNVTTS